MILSNPRERERFLKFAVVGVIGAIVDFGLFNLSIAFLRMPAVWASALSFTAAVISNFTWNRFWTYPDSRSKQLSQQLAQFALVSAIGLGIRIPMVATLEIPMINLFTRILPRPFIFTPTFAGHNVTLAIAVLVVMMWNFFANRFWTYNDVN